MRLAVFQPDIPQNLGGAIRLSACLAVRLEIIGPCGFPLSDRALKRAAMDYREHADVAFHDSWTAFGAAKPAASRLVLFTTQAAASFLDFAFAPDDVLLFGRESAGVPDEVHAAADARLRIPIASGSLNVVAAAAIGLGEGLRQTSGFPAAASTV